MKFRTKNYYKTILTGGILLVVLVIFLMWEREQMKEQAFESVKSKTSDIASILQGVIQSQYRCGRADSLGSVLENVMSFSEIQYVIISREGRVVLESGKKEDFCNQSTANGFELKNGKFYFWKHVDESIISAASKLCSNECNLIQDKCDKKENRCKDQNLYARDVFLGIVVQNREYFERIRKCDIELLINLFAGIFAIVIFSVGWIHLIRNNELKLELATVKKKNEFLSELSFAASGLAHETKNPLGIVRGLAQKITLTKDAGNASQEIVFKIIDEIDVITERLSDFMNYARVSELKKEPLKLKDLLEEIGELMKYDFDRAGVVLETMLDDVRVEADREAVIQIIVNLLQNSIKASFRGGVIHIDLTRKEEFAELSVIDSGSGIDTVILNDIFKPYVSGTKNGHGIGLAIVKKLIDAADWEITVNSVPGKGTMIQISKIKIV